MAQNWLYSRYWNAHEYKVSFLGIPKNGSTSVRRRLGIDPQKWSHDPAPEYKTFTVLRDPISRLKSGWAESIRRRTCPEDIKTFGDLVRCIDQTGYFDEHLVPQSVHFERVDVVFRFEVDFMRAICEWIQIEFLPIRENASVYQAIEVDAESEKIARRLYADDFRLIENYRRTFYHYQNVLFPTTGRL